MYSTSNLDMCKIRGCITWFCSMVRGVSPCSMASGSFSQAWAGLVCFSRDRKAWNTSAFTFSSLSCKHIIH